MPLNLPKPIEAYFAIGATNADAVSMCFAENAVVKDEGNTYEGRDAIKKWIENSVAEYSFTSTPFASEEIEDMTIVTSTVSGTFPGSPIDLRYAFVLIDSKIASLEIAV